MAIQSVKANLILLNQGKGTLVKICTVSKRVQTMLGGATIAPSRLLFMLGQSLRLSGCCQASVLFLVTPSQRRQQLQNEGNPFHSSLSPSNRQINATPCQPGLLASIWPVKEAKLITVHNKSDRCHSLPLVWHHPSPAERQFPANDSRRALLAFMQIGSTARGEYRTWLGTLCIINCSLFAIFPRKISHSFKANNSHAHARLRRAGAHALFSSDHSGKLASELFMQN